MAKLGDAYIDVHANDDPFRRELPDGLHQATKDAEKILDDVGKVWGDKLGKSTADELEKHGPEMGRAMEKASEKVKVKVRSEFDYYNVRDKKGRFAKRIADDLEGEIEQAFKTATGPGGPFQKIGGDIGEALGSGFNLSGKNSLLGVLVPVIAALVAGLIQLINLAAGIVLTLPGAITAVALQVGVLFLAFKGLGTAISGAFAAKNAKELQAAIKNLTPQAQTFVKSLLPLKDFFISLQKVVQSKFFSAFGNAIPQIFKALGPTFFSGLTSLAGALGTAFRTLALIFASPIFKTFLSDVFTRTIDWLKQFAPAFSHFLQSFFGIADQALPFLTQLGLAISLNLDALGTFFDNLNKSGAVKSWLASLGPTLDSFFRLFGSLNVLIVTLLNTTDKAGGKSVLDTLADALDRLSIFFASPAGVKALEGLIDIGNIAIKMFVGLVVVIGLVAAAIEKVGEIIHSWVRGSNIEFEIVRNWFIGVGKTIGNWVSDVGHFFIWLGEKIQQAWDFIRRMVHGIVGDIGSRINAMIGFFASIPSRIRAAIGDLGSLLFNAGKSLVQGLINGIKHMIQPLQDVLSWITAHLPHWKGPEDKDMKILEPAGRAVMGGFITGLQLGAKDLRDALTGITQSIAGSGTSTTNTQSINFTPGSINISFMGNPTPDQAYQTGVAVGAGINSQLAVRNVALGVRRL